MLMYITFSLLAECFLFSSRSLPSLLSLITMLSIVYGYLVQCLTGFIYDSVEVSVGC